MNVSEIFRDQMVDLMEGFEPWHPDDPLLKRGSIYKILKLSPTGFVFGEGWFIGIYRGITFPKWDHVEMEDIQFCFDVLISKSPEGPFLMTDRLDALGVERISTIRVGHGLINSGDLMIKKISVSDLLLELNSGSKFPLLDRILKEGL